MLEQHLYARTRTSAGRGGIGDEKRDEPGHGKSMEPARASHIAVGRLLTCNARGKFAVSLCLDFASCFDGGAVSACRRCLPSRLSPPYVVVFLLAFEGRLLGSKKSEQSEVERHRRPGTPTNKTSFLCVLALRDRPRERRALPISPEIARDRPRLRGAAEIAHPGISRARQGGWVGSEVASGQCGRGSDGAREPDLWASDVRLVVAPNCTLVEEGDWDGGGLVGVSQSRGRVLVRGSVSGPLTGSQGLNCPSQTRDLIRLHEAQR